MLPRATYRLQLHAGCTFDDAAAVVPQLAVLGISHLYCSPILQAAPGSTHGYDVVDHGRLGDELGGRTGFDRLARVAAEHDLSLVVDLVPNHVALAGAANRWWWDVLEDGPASPHARAFDIDWAAGPSDGPTVLMPILGDHLGRLVEAGALVLRRVGGSFVVRYEEHELPLAPRTTEPLVRAAGERSGSEALLAIAERLASVTPGDKADVAHDLREATAADPAAAATLDDVLASVSADPDLLEGVLDRQHHRLAHWRVASDELDYRRFFDVTTLAGLRVEDDAVFDASHALVLELVAGGEVTGLRIDHVDGLRDPARYLDRLAAAAPGCWIVVEKILGADERLPPTWPVAGTTGYEFAERVGDALLDADGFAALVEHHRRFAGAPDDFAEVARAGRLRVLEHELAAEVDRVTGLAVALCRARRRHRDHTRRDVRAAVRELAASYDVYRTYVVPGHPVAEADRARVAGAVERTKAARPDLDVELLDLLGRALVLEEAGAEELAVRFQQLSAPAMAKGIEDTAFYRWVPLLAVNEVGADPGEAGRGPEPFHEHNRRVAVERPATMLTLSTHDTKRSADVRARLSVLAEIPASWTAAVDRWRVRNAAHRAGWDDPTMELVLYQSMVGAWPIGADRLEPMLRKSANEAKVRTSWRDQDEAVLAGLGAFVRGVACDAAFVAEVEAFLAEHDLVRRGRLRSLAQVALLHTSPGVPDTYQGDELWDLSLVDPDNRRPVDFQHRRTLLVDVAEAGPDDVLARMDEGAPKLWLAARLLQRRRADPDRFRSAVYEPLPATGPHAGAVLAFHRGDLTTIVPRRTDVASWAGTSIELPAGEWDDVLGGGTWSGPIDLGDLLARFPVAVLERRLP